MDGRKVVLRSDTAGNVMLVCEDCGEEFLALPNDRHAPDSMFIDDLAEVLIDHARHPCIE